MFLLSAILCSLHRTMDSGIIATTKHQKGGFPVWSYFLHTYKKLNGSSKNDTYLIQIKAVLFIQRHGKIYTLNDARINDSNDF